MLIDDVTAYAALSARAEDQWGVSASINVAFHAPFPDSAETLHCTATVDHRTRRWAYASGDVLTNTGDLIATVGQRFRYIPGSSAVHQRPVVPVHPSYWLESIDTLLEAPKQGANSEVELRVKPHQGMLNPLGIIHGGISLCLSEQAARMACEKPPGEPTEALHTSSIHISYLRPGLPTGTPVIYVKFLHASRSVILAEVTLRNSTGEIATHAVITLHRSHTTS